MTKPVRRYVWRVELPTGELLFLNTLASARLAVSPHQQPPDVRTLHRAGRGRYWSVVTYQTLGGPTTQLIRVSRIRATAAAVERENDRLPFDQLIVVAPGGDVPDGV